MTLWDICFCCKLLWFCSYHRSLFFRFHVGSGVHEWPHERLCGPVNPGKPKLTYFQWKHLLFLHHSCFNTKEVFFQDNGSLYLTIVQTWLDMERERVYEISGLFHHLFHDFQTIDAKKKTSWDVFLVSVVLEIVKEMVKKKQIFSICSVFPYL